MGFSAPAFSIFEGWGNKLRYSSINLGFSGLAL
jgi:hypothetical protein